MDKHFESAAFELVKLANLDNDSLVVEIGCNDGIFLI